MNTRLLLLVFLFFVFPKQEIFGQLGFSHEIGVITGPVAFYSDYGVRNDFETNSGNIGFGVGIIHYINFAYRDDCNCYSRDLFFNDHFKIRNEIDFHKTNLEHFGKWVDPDKTSITADQLRAMKGSTTVFEIGSQLEYFPMSIRDFQAGGHRIAPVYRGRGTLGELRSRSIFGTRPVKQPYHNSTKIFRRNPTGRRFDLGHSDECGDTI